MQHSGPDHSSKNIIVDLTYTILLSLSNKTNFNTKAFKEIWKP